MTLAAIVLGVVSLIIVGGFVADIFVQLQENTIHSQLGHIQIYKQGYTTFGRKEPYHYVLEQPEAIAKELAGWHEVSEVMMRLNFTGLANNGRADFPIFGEGVEPDKEARLGTSLAIHAGRQLTDADGFGILLGQGVAKALNLNPGDYVTLLANTPEGALNSIEFQVIGIFQTFSKEYDERAVRIPLSAAQELMAATAVHSLVILLSDTADTDSALHRLGRWLPAETYEIKAWYELADFYRKTVDLYERQFGVLKIIILVMVLLSVGNSVNMAIYERTGEFGTLMALGRRSGDIIKIILLEYALLGLMGSVLGIIIGVVIAYIASGVGIPMPPPPNADMGYTASVRIVPSVILAAFLVGVLATIMAAVLPSRRAAKLQIVEALRSNI
ncbi:ABC transporter permease [Methylocaldum marinum]|uniref:ABC transporter permease n=1 Tax=Methylocaldum marinum TaxID=1432792 RepID=UPI0018D52C4C|nr:ABC transporter permease [Methylocaldum marinum]